MGRRIALLAFATALSTPASADPLAAKMYAITKWDAACSGDERGSWDNMAYAWYDELADGSLYYHAGIADNNNINNLWFSDKSLLSGADDRAHLDGADAAMIAWHGGDKNGVYRGSMRTRGGGGDDCHVRQDNMKLGNGDLEFLHMSSCHSMDQNMWSSWVDSFAGLHQIDGFHGVMYITSPSITYYADFADDGFDEDLADAWIDNTYAADAASIGSTAGVGYAQCPVAYSVSNSPVDAIIRLLTERYNYTYTDPTGNYWAAYYVVACAPKSEDPIHD